MRNKQESNDNIRGLRVEVRNGDVNQALRRFKKKVTEDGVLQEVRDRSEYTKPSIKRARAKAAGRARHLKRIEKRKNDLGY